METFLMVAFALLPVVWGLVQYWWLPSLRERDLERQLSKTRDPHTAGIMVDAALADTKREAERRREGMNRDMRFF